MTCSVVPSRALREVAAQSTKRIAGGNTLQYSSVPLLPPGMHCSQPFTPTEKLILHYRRRDPQKVTHRSIFHRLPLLYLTRDQFLMKAPRKGNN